MALPSAVLDWNEWNVLEIALNKESSERLNCMIHNQIESKWLSKLNNSFTLQWLVQSEGQDLAAFVSNLTYANDDIILLLLRRISVENTSTTIRWCIFGFTDCAENRNK